MAIRKPNTTCAVCGKGYYLCIACERNKSNWKPWKVIVDDENCYNIYDIVSKYIANNITKYEAKELLNTTDLSDLDNFKDLMKNKIKEILDLETVTTAEITENNIENVEVKIAENTESEKETVVAKKRYSKKTEE